MSEQQKHINHYSLTDIEQYLHGKLSPSAMHELEKAALQDPFLADAIEGYREADLDDVKDDLAHIHQQLLSGEKVEAEIIETSSKQNNWLRIAALFIVFAGAGASAWYLLNRDDQKTAIVQQPVNNNRKDSLSKVTVMEIKKDTITIVPKSLQTIITHKPDSLLAKNNSTKKNPALYADKMNIPLKNLVAANSIKGFSFIQRSDSNLADIQRSVPVAMAVSIPVSANKLPGDSVKNPYKEIVALADKQEKDEPYKPLTGTTIGGNGKLMVTGTVAAQGLSNTVTAFQPTLSKTISSENTLDEVVVTGYPTQRKKDVTGAFTISAPNKKDTILIGEGRMNLIVPVGGMKVFSDYLINQLILHANLKKEPGKYGTLKLRLGFDENGKIINVKIKRSFDKKLNPILIKAITEGPLWILPKKEKTDFDLTILL